MIQITATGVGSEHLIAFRKAMYSAVRGVVHPHSSDIGRDGDVIFLWQGYLKPITDVRENTEK
jgi:hypothetical protein